MKNYPAQVDPQWNNSIGFSDFPSINSKNWHFFTKRDFWYLNFPVADEKNPQVGPQT